MGQCQQGHEPAAGSFLIEFGYSLIVVDKSEKKERNRHIVLNSHPTSDQKPTPLQWGAATAAERGPVVGTASAVGVRNAIGAHSGSYAVYRALAVAAGDLSALHKPDLTDTSPSESIGPHAQWKDADKIVSLDPYGHMVTDAFADALAAGDDIRPTIAVTRARLTLPEIAVTGITDRLEADGRILLESGEINVTKVAIEPVWHLPGIARRCEIDEAGLRKTLFEQTGGMYAELVTRPDIKVFLPPIGGHTLYIFGDIADLSAVNKSLTCRVHDECSGSDVFGSDICTCRPYLIHGIEECIRDAQQGGTGLIVYNRKEGRALGEVTKFLVYNARKRQAGGDTADAYFERTECVAGVQDVRFQQLMPDPLHWLGVTRIDRFVSMSNMKYDAIVGQGIEIVERVSLPDELIPEDAHVEMEAKKAAGYYTEDTVMDTQDLGDVQGRNLADYDS